MPSWLKKISLLTRLAHAGLVALFLLAPFPSVSQDLPVRELVIRSKDGTEHRFMVEVAASTASRAKGLMYRRELAPDAGMLFDFEVTLQISMWMKNTLLPLDMFFVVESGRIVNIAERTVPGSLLAIPADEPVRYVIELVGGTASRLRLKAGDKVIKGLGP
ncbi:MAG: DUF192 domain-containing protein [Alphaproteobacteria bacterium]|nr:DUF192 domain-containing protein [Alphaproteobacteria bacterium]